jgi:hypothetical protein
MVPNTIFFNSALQCAVRKDHKNQEELELNDLKSVTFYAAGIDLLREYKP